MKIFVGGSRVVSELNTSVIQQLEMFIRNNFTIIVGDAEGIDKAVQQFCLNKNYRNVIVYATNGKARNNIGKWIVKAVEVSPQTTGYDFYAAKDIAMAQDTDYGFMVWNGKSRGTRNNMKYLTDLNKKVLLFLTKTNNFCTIENKSEIRRIVNM